MNCFTFAVIVGILASSAAASADEPPRPAPAARVPGPSPVATPPAPSYDEEDDEEDEDDKPRRDKAAFGAGLALAITGGAAAFIGTLLSLPMSCSDSEPPQCQPTIPLEAGVPMIALGAIAFAVGVPLAVWGNKRMPSQPASPAVAIGPRGAAARWSF